MSTFWRLRVESIRGVSARMQIYKLGCSLNRSRVTVSTTFHIRSEQSIARPDLDGGSLFSAVAASLLQHSLSTSRRASSVSFKLQVVGGAVAAYPAQRKLARADRDALERHSN